MGSSEAAKVPQSEVPPPLPSGRVVAASDATPLLRRLEVRHDAAPTPQYTVAGQYLKVQAPGGQAGMFALAQAPGRPLELLVKRGGPVADSLVALGEGDVVLLSGAQGKGFPVAEAAGRDVWLFAVGSGIAPIRALVQALVADQDRARHGKVTLYEGQREPEHFGFAAERAAWRAAGVTVVEVLSRPHHNWSGRTGHVQNALLEDRPDGAGAVAYLCGMKAMVEGVRETAATLGLPRERTFLNY